VDEYIKILDDVVEGKYLNFELEYNDAVVNSNSPWKWRKINSSPKSYY